MKTHLYRVLAATTALALAACGGGGGGGGDVTLTNTYAVNAAQRHLLVECGS